jgi:RNA polymerase sigma-70 factor (ECF subfamily)
MLVLPRESSFAAPDWMPMNEPEAISESTSPPRPAPIDTVSLRRVKAGNPDALEAFFEFYFDRVYGYLVRVLHERSDADDAVQECFLRISRRVDRLDPDRDPTGWVFRIASNAARDLWRGRSRGARGLESAAELDWNSIPPDPAESAQDRIEREQQAELIVRALERLSAADREIVFLRDYEDLSTATIAETLDVSPDVVRQRHSRALRRLGQSYRQLMGEEDTPA